MRDLRITDTFTVPIEIATRKTSIVAKSDSGKSYALRRILECIVGSGFRIPGAMFDPLGVAYGVRYGPDGESPGLSVPIFGGAHGDMPITYGSGPKIARALIESKTIGILDLSDLDDEEQFSFGRDFVKAVGQILNEARQPFWLGADEADHFSPEMPAKGLQAECQRAFRYYCRRIRNFGGGYTFATQSTSVIDKKVVGQSDLIIAMHITSPTDQKPVVEWLTPGVGATEARRITHSLATFQKGDAVFYSPAWLKRVEPAHISLCETFDSSKTPEIGEVIETVGTGAKIDLDALRDALLVDSEEAEDSNYTKDSNYEKYTADVERLNSCIVELEAQLAEEREARTLSHIEIPAFEDDDVEAITDAASQLVAVGERIAEVGRSINEKISEALERLASASVAKIPVKMLPAKSLPDRSGQVRTSTYRDEIGPYAISILRGLVRRLPAQWTPRAMVAALAGKSAKSSAFVASLSSLERAQMISVVDGKIAISPAGISASGVEPPSRPLSTSEAVDVWANALGNTAGAVLRYLVAAHQPMTKDQVAAGTAYSKTSSGFDGALRELRSNGLIAIDGQMVTCTLREMLR